jgi:hypothetical protein
MMTNAPVKLLWESKCVLMIDDSRKPMIRNFGKHSDKYNLFGNLFSIYKLRKFPHHTEWPNLLMIPNKKANYDLVVFLMNDDLYEAVG